MKIESAYHPLGSEDYLDVILKDEAGNLWTGLLKGVKWEN